MFIKSGSSYIYIPITYTPKSKNTTTMAMTTSEVPKTEQILIFSVISIFVIIVAIVFLKILYDTFKL